MRTAQVNADGLVVNVMLVEPDQLAAFQEAFRPDQLIEAPDEVGPGFTFDGEAWTPPPGSEPPEPPSPFAPLSPRQIRLGLLHAGITGAMVEQALEGNEEGLIEWRYANSFVRDHPLIEALAGSFGLTDEQIDEMWLAALQL